MATADIVSTLECCACGATGKKNFSRIHKQSFKTKLDVDGNVIPEQKLEWRIFKCKSCDENTHVSQLGDNVYVSEEYVGPCLPISAFTWWFEYEPEMDCDYGNGKTAHYDSGITLWVGYTDKLNDDYVPYDDVRDEHLFGVFDYLHQKGILCDNAMENAWEVHVSRDSYMKVPRTDEEVMQYIRDLLTAIGGVESPELAQDNEGLVSAKTTLHVSAEKRYAEIIADGLIGFGPDLGIQI